MWNWLKVHEENDLSFLYKNEYFHGKPLTFSQFKKLKNSFDKLKQSHLEAFGLGDRGEYIIDIKLEIIKSASDYLKHKNLVSFQMTKILLEKLKQEEARSIKQSLQDEVNAVEDVLNRSLNLRKLTVKEYRSKATFAERKASSNNG